MISILALSGHRLKGSDCLHAGIATHACNDISKVKEELFSASNKEDIENILEKHAEEFEENAFSLEDKIPLIDECFKENSVEDIIKNLRNVKAQFLYFSPQIKFCGWA